MFDVLTVGLFSVLALLPTQDWTQPKGPDTVWMQNAFVDGKEPMSINQKLVMWKEMHTGSNEEQVCQTQLFRKYASQLKNPKPLGVQKIKSQWAIELLPFALAGVDEHKAEFLWKLSSLDSESKHPLIGLEMRIVHALACGRRGFADDATNEIESVIASLRNEQARNNQGDSQGKPEPIEFFGKTRSIDEILHECYGYRAVIRAINVQTMARPGQADPASQDDISAPDKEESPDPSSSPRDLNYFQPPVTSQPAAPFDDDLMAVPDRPSLLQADENFLAIFEVDGNRFVSKAIRDAESAELATAVWKRISTLFPLHFRREIVQFNIQGGRRWAGFFSGSGENDVGRKGFRLSIAKYTAEEEPDLKNPNRPPTPRRGTLDWTLVHELGHYVCLQSNAIELFSQEFDGDDRPQPERRKQPTDYPADGSPKTSGSFVTSYAERSGGDEEVVESFTTFIMIEKIPEGDSLVEQKIRFFNSIPGFQDLRAHVQRLRTENPGR